MQMDDARSSLLCVAVSKFELEGSVPVYGQNSRNGSARFVPNPNDVGNIGLGCGIGGDQAGFAVLADIQAAIRSFPGNCRVACHEGLAAIVIEHEERDP